MIYLEVISISENDGTQPAHDVVLEAVSMELSQLAETYLDDFEVMPKEP